MQPYNRCTATYFKITPAVNMCKRQSKFETQNPYQVHFGVFPVSIETVF